MKKFLCLIFVGITIDCAQAQTNDQITPPQFKTVLVTNWVKPGEYLRIVDGKLYNTAYSKLFKNPILLTSGLALRASNFHFIRYDIIADSIDGDTIFCDIRAITWWFETYTGQPQDESWEDVKTIVILHYPHPEKIVTGQSVPCVCMRVANYLTNSHSFEAYDCGIQSTNPVAVVKQMKVKASDTNSISK